jgi:hypothetical protein
MRQIEELLEAPADGEAAPSLALLEAKLTDGYAQVLALEVERSRIERRIGEVASTAEERAELGLAAELTTLAGRMRSADRELRTLRSLLGQLQARTRATRRQTMPDLTA